jgi:hypothetical protein
VTDAIDSRRDERSRCAPQRRAWRGRSRISRGEERVGVLRLAGALQYRAQEARRSAHV